MSPLYYAPGLPAAYFWTGSASSRISANYVRRRPAPGLPLLNQNRMKTLFPNFCTLLLLTLSTSRQVEATAPARPAVALSDRQPTADEQLFTKLVNEVAAAIEKHDMDALSKLMAPAYVHFSPDNKSGHKADELTFIKTWPKTTSKVVGPVLVTRSGNMAVTVSREAYTFTEGTKQTQRTLEHMIAWMLNDGHWQMAVVQSKDVPA